MRAVNLLPPDVNRRRAPNKLALAAAASSGTVVMLLGAGYLSAHSTVRDRQGTLEQVNAELAALPKPKAQTAATKAQDVQLAQERLGRLSALSTVLSQRVAWDRVLREVSQVLPDDVWLQQLTVSAPTQATSAPPVAGSTTTVTAPAPVSSGTTFSIQGRTYTQEGVARLLLRLQLVPDLQNVQLGSSQLRSDGSSYDVTINADVKSSEATQ